MGCTVANGCRLGFLFLIPYFNLVFRAHWDGVGFLVCYFSFAVLLEVVFFTFIQYSEYSH